MFSNIGGKIKSLAVVVFILCVIGIFVESIPLFKNDAAGAAIVTIVVGITASWIALWFLYAFGELVEATRENERNTAEIMRMLGKRGSTFDQSSADLRKTNQCTKCGEVLSANTARSAEPKPISLHNRPPRPPQASPRHPSCRIVVNAVIVFTGTPALIAEDLQAMHNTRQRMVV